MCFLFIVSRTPSPRGGSVGVDINSNIDVGAPNIDLGLDISGGVDLGGPGIDLGGPGLDLGVPG